MKKILLVAVLCLTPIFTSHAVKITGADCTIWSAHLITKHKDDFDKMSDLMQNVIKTQDIIETWVNRTETTTKENQDISDKCTTARGFPADSTESIRAYKNIELILEDLLNEYKRIETQARMPFVHHGNILPGPDDNENGSDYVRTKFIPRYINGMLIFMISFSILMVIVGGIMFVYSSGDSELTSRAKTTIMWAIMGVIITILSYSIVKFVIGINFAM